MPEYIIGQINGILYVMKKDQKDIYREYARFGDLVRNAEHVLNLLNGDSGAKA